MSKNNNEENRIIALRRAYLAELRQKGNTFPNDFRRQHLSAELHEAYGDGTKESLDEQNIRTAVTGRVVLRRLMGRASFITLQDMTGQIQLYIRQDMIGKDEYADFKRWDIGDIIGATGTVMRTNKGELSVSVDKIHLLTKCLRPLPEKHKGLTDTETRYRQRYLDLMVNQDSRNVFIRRARIINAIRQYFIERSYMEVETPMMQSTPGGATAAPFVTHYNALDVDMYLRVAPELNLKRLVVGGFERVFEINRNFRNEGMSARHSPEFTMLEFYQAYMDYKDLMDLTEDLFRELAQSVLGSTRFNYQGTTLDFSQPFKRSTLKESILEFNPRISPADLASRQSMEKTARAAGVDILPGQGEGKLLMDMFEALVEEKIEQPLFITGYPTEVSPLARRSDNAPEMTDRFELFIMGKEIANGFSELNDSEDQAERFKQQVMARESGDDEAMYFDEDYITALEFGLPPTAGEGIGIDRLVMLLTDSPSIRDVVLFPHMRLKH